VSDGVSSSPKRGGGGSPSLNPPLSPFHSRGEIIMNNSIPKVKIKPQRSQTCHTVKITTTI